MNVFNPIKKKKKRFDLLKLYYKIEISANSVVNEMSVLPLKWNLTHQKIYCPTSKNKGGKDKTLTEFSESRYFGAWPTLESYLTTEREREREREDCGTLQEDGLRLTMKFSWHAFSSCKYSSFAGQQAKKITLALLPLGWQALLLRQMPWGKQWYVLQAKEDFSCLDLC